MDAVPAPVMVAIRALAAARLASLLEWCLTELRGLAAEGETTQDGRDPASPALPAASPKLLDRDTTRGSCLL